MSAADEYRRHAVECGEAAKVAARPDMRRVLIYMATRWTELADRMEELGAAETLMDRCHSLATAPRLPLE